LSLFDWGLFADAESFLRTSLNGLLGRNSAAERVAFEIQRGTSTSIFDWVDHLALPAEKVDTDELVKMGFEEQKKISGDEAVFRVQGSTLFPLILKSGRGSEVVLAVEDIENFRKVIGKEKGVQGLANSSFRELALSSENDFTFSILERRGSSGYMIENSDDIVSYVEALNALESRERRVCIR